MLSTFFYSGSKGIGACCSIHFTWIKAKLQKINDKSKSSLIFRMILNSDG